MSALLAALYALCILFLTGFALFVFTRNPRSRLHRDFALLALALLGWVASLFAFDFNITGAYLLWLGRFNFASVVFAATLAYLFVREVAGRPPLRFAFWLWAETWLLGALTLLTPLVDRQELVRAGQHVTLYGPVFVPYVLHALVLLGAALGVAFGAGREAHERAGHSLRLAERHDRLTQRRSQLRVIGFGIVAVAAVALVTNVYLPYALGNFRLIHVGTLSTALFLLAVGYAVFAYHLFSVRVIVRAAFVLAGLIALALELYSLALSSLAHLLPFGDPREREFAATALVLIVNAFTQEPVKRWLERTVERLIDRAHYGHLPRRDTIRPPRP